MDRTLFILDDSKDFTEFLQEMLDHKRFAYKYKIFNDVTNFETEINEDMKAVVLDFYLPKKDGLEVMKLIRIKAPDCLIIFVSVNEDTQLPLAALRDRYVTFVGKTEDDYASIIVDIVERHFKLLDLEKEFLEGLQRQGKKDEKRRLA
jgi:two-component system, NtrC family, response regulator AtoC